MIARIPSAIRHNNSLRRLFQNNSNPPSCPVRNKFAHKGPTFSTRMCMIEIHNIFKSPGLVPDKSECEFSQDFVLHSGDTFCERAHDRGSAGGGA